MTVHTIEIPTELALDLLRGDQELVLHASAPGIELTLPMKVALQLEPTAETPAPSAATSSPTSARRPPAGREFRCPDCGDTFPTPQAQGAHRRRQHPRQPRPEVVSKRPEPPAHEDDNEDEEPVSPFAAFPPLADKQHPEEGVCATEGCTTRLSRYNDSTHCSVHEQARRLRGLSA